MKTAVIIPAFNSEKTIKSVIHGVESVLTDGTIIVVDDGSTDKTNEFARECGVTVLSHPENSGKGAALKTGFQEAYKSDVEFVITLDSDGQHKPRHIPAFFEVMEQNQADVVIGNRMHSLRKMPFHRMVSNKTTSRMISLRIGVPVEDSQCGFRLIRTEVLHAITLRTTHFDLESELIIKAGLAGFKIRSVPIDTVYNNGSSAIHHLKDTARFVKLFFQSFLWY